MIVIELAYTPTGTNVAYHYFHKVLFTSSAMQQGLYPILIKACSTFTCQFLCQSLVSSCTSTISQKTFYRFFGFSATISDKLLTNCASRVAVSLISYREISDIFTHFTLANEVKKRCNWFKKIMLF